MTDLEKQLADRLAKVEGFLSELLERKQGDFDCPFCDQFVTYWPEGHKDTCLVPRVIRYMEKYYGKRVR